jgi:hypothetical protein
MGAQFLNEILNWKGPTIFIELTKYANKVSQGRAIITKRDYLDEFVGIFKKKRTDAAKDL